MKYALRDRPGDSTRLEKSVALLRHPAYAWAGLRPALGQHTYAEHSALRKWAKDRSTLVEIGVAEGVSARALREGMGADACLYLIDPFHLSRVQILNFMRRVARRAVADCDHGKVVWLQKFSHELAASWTKSIDLLFIDGDHAERAVEQDWIDWTKFVRPGGVVLLHDACLFEGGWTTPEYGPVKFADRFLRSGDAVGWRMVEEVHSLIVLERI